MNPIARSLALIAALAFAAVAQTPAPATVADLYDHQTVMIAMRDGVRLNTEIFIPKGATEPLPILFRRSPYGVSASSILAAAPNAPYKELADDGYIFAFQDLRGRYKSEGQFV